MESATNKHLLELRSNIATIAKQEIPLLPTSPLYNLFEVRKKIALRILRGELTSQEEEMMIDLIDSYNSNIKKYIGL